MSQLPEKQLVYKVTKVQGLQTFVVISQSEYCIVLSHVMMDLAYARDYRLHHHHHCLPPFLPFPLLCIFLLQHLSLQRYNDMTCLGQIVTIIVIAWFKLCFRKSGYYANSCWESLFSFKFPKVSL